MKKAVLPFLFFGLLFIFSVSVSGKANCPPLQITRAAMNSNSKL